MLLFNFVINLMHDYPELSASLTLEDIVGFVVLAGKVFHCFEEGFGLSATVSSVLPFLSNTLELSISPRSIEQLWI
ncbi:hypothetical protein CROQUDRAFT_681800 [Cronartium quercuum f. sp. fusiforme G11]|uniref:Uncharacterized protein n=1 Tax=Cronartium quercuum f. sp. fusiforme G11 TaxID=708437 RepID=A0A9P6NTV2_9BASI|nr:hypothetical protein CROQUDRAFT_681800 [Cronartium quercuum f. sp. fusiforme G11]